MTKSLKNLTESGLHQLKPAGAPLTLPGPLSVCLSEPPHFAFPSLLCQLHALVYSRTAFTQLATQMWAQARILRELGERQRRLLPQGSHRKLLESAAWPGLVNISSGPTIVLEDRTWDAPSQSGPLLGWRGWGLWGNGTPARSRWSGRSPISLLKEEGMWIQAKWLLFTTEANNNTKL